MTTSDPAYDDLLNGGPAPSRSAGGSTGLPQDQAAEAAVLGAILAAEGVYNRIAGALDARDFFDPRHRAIFAAAERLFDRSEEIDQITVAAELQAQGRLQEAGGHPYLNQLVLDLPSTVGAEQYAELVQRAATYRDVISVAGRIGEIGYDASPDVGESLTRAMELLFSVRGADRRRDFTLLHDILPSAFPLPTDPDAQGAPTRTGFLDLDEQLNGGVRPADLMVLAARPGAGKSALALKLAINAALEQKLAVAIFSLEMTDLQIAERLLTAVSRIPLTRLKTVNLTDEEDREFSRAHALLSQAQIYIDDTAGQTLTEIRAKSRNLYKRLEDQAARAGHGDGRGRLGLIIVDHMQLVHGYTRMRSDGNRVNEMSIISRTLKEIARELHVPMLALSQLSRAITHRHPPIPQLQDLRDSGSIEQDADIVTFIYHAQSNDAGLDDGEWTDNTFDPSPKPVELIVAKQRHGQTGSVEVRWVPKLVTFEDFYEYAPDGSGF